MNPITRNPTAMARHSCRYSNYQYCPNLSLSRSPTWR